MDVLTMMEAAKRDSMVHRLSPITKGIYCILMIAIPIITINPFVSLIIFTKMKQIGMQNYSYMSVYTFL